MSGRLSVYSRCFLLILFATSSLRAQSSSAPAAGTPPVPVAKLDYPDSTSGLERLVKDILKAQLDNDNAGGEALLMSLVLPNPRSWYESTFGPVIAKNEGALYEQASSEMPRILAKNFLDALHFQSNQIEVKRFERGCDDNSGEFTFGILHARLEPVALYEVRFLKGDKLIRLFAFTFVDGKFRFVIAPKLEGKVFPPVLRETAPDGNENAAGAGDGQIERVAAGGNVQAARLIHRVQPKYPAVARREHVQGTVTLHALITKDGTIRQLYVLKGYCSLAQSALDAVSKWRYSPTLVMGNPVEVDTEIDVNYELRQ